MKIIYDLTFITPNNFYKGIPVHSMRILDAVPMEKRKDITLFINESLQDFANNHFVGYKLIFTPKLPGILKKVFYHFIYKYYYRSVINKSRCDAYIVANEYNRFSLQKISIPKFIFSHDLKGTKKCYNTSREKMIRRYRMYKESLETASLVFAISEYTKNDIKEIYPSINQSKIKVLYNSIALAELSVKPSGIKEDENFILTVNHLDRYKNALTTIKAFAEISSIFKGKLVIVSRPTPYWEEDCLPYIAGKGLSDNVVLLTNMSNEELKWLYEHAKLFVSSSTHEGFGFTPIEAAICKSPVICTGAEALAETTMGRLEYYAPADDYKQLAYKMMNIIKNPPSDIQLEATSKLFSEKYSPSMQVKIMFEYMDEYLNSVRN